MIINHDPRKCYARSIASAAESVVAFCERHASLDVLSSTSETGIRSDNICDALSRGLASKSVPLALPLRYHLS
jgi:hypothetical protein